MVDDPLHVLMITSEWPPPDKPYQVPFIVRQVRFLREAGVEVEVFHFRGNKNPARYAAAWNQAREKINSGKFDLVHAQWGQSGMLALPKRLPLVVTFRGDDLEGIIGANGKKTAYGRVLQTVSRLVARAADQVVVVSETLAKQFHRRNYHVIPSGLDMDLFCPAPQQEARSRLGLDLNRRYILFAGASGNPRKRYGLAKEAVEMLQKEMDVELLTASDVAHDQIPDYMNASDALLLVSLHEGSPNVIKEAMACNRPIVSTNVGDVRERIGAIPGNVLLADDRLTTITDALREVLTHNQPVNNRSAVQSLDERLLTQKVIAVYRQALSGKEKRSSS